MKDQLGKLLLEWRIRTVLPHVRGTLLDIGCGTNKLTRAYGSGVGVDVYPWDGVDLVVPDSARLPFGSDTYDTVSIIAALNHIPNREDVVQEAWRVLRPGGRIIVTMLPPLVSACWHLLRRRWDTDQSERGMKAGEVYGLTTARVDDLLTKAGFQVKRRARFMLGLNCLTVAEKSWSAVVPVTGPEAAACVPA